jgi:hypothetical protein
MRRRDFHRIGLLWLLAPMLGCASKTVDGDKPVPTGAADRALVGRMPGHVALLIRPQVLGTVTRVKYQPVEGLEVPVGLIVEEAALAALGHALQGGALRMDEWPTADKGCAASLVVEAVRLEHDVSVTLGLIPLPPYLLPVPFLRSHLAFDLSLWDVQGQAVWARTYDGRHETVTQKAVSKWESETLPVSLVRTAQDSARRLSQEMAADVLQWLAAERSKPRDL